MDQKMNFSERLDVMVGKVFAIYQKTVIRVQRFIHSKVCLHTSLIRLKLEYASCVWGPFYDVRADKVERMLRRFILYALRSLSRDVLFCALTLLWKGALLPV
jgi:hypothetical protein